MYSAEFAPNSLGEYLSRWSTLRDCFSLEWCRFAVGRHLKPSPICPGCGVSLGHLDVDRLYSGASVVCRDCGKKHRMTTGTVLEGVHADMRDILLIAAMTAWEEPVSDIVKVTGLSDDTIRRIQRLRLGAK
jgi:hypothetical protein